MSNLKIDSINKNIISIIHKNADISNQELAEKVGLSTSACFQRTKALKESGYFISFTCDLDLDRICEHVLAYVEFKLVNNGHAGRKAFEEVIESKPEFMDCLRVSGDTDYICFTCCNNIQDLNQLCDELTSNETLGVSNIKTRIILERSKWYLGYPLNKLKWLSE